MPTSIAIAQLLPYGLIAAGLAVLAAILFLNFRNSFSLRRRQRSFVAHYGEFDRPPTSPALPCTSVSPTHFIPHIFSSRESSTFSTPRPSPSHSSSTPHLLIRPAPANIQNLKRSVYALADAGLQAPDIARKLNEHLGKIQLVLALRDPSPA